MADNPDFSSDLSSAEAEQGNDSNTQRAQAALQGVSNVLAWGRSMAGLPGMGLGRAQMRGPMITGVQFDTGNDIGNFEENGPNDPFSMDQNSPLGGYAKGGTVGYDDGGTVDTGDQDYTPTESWQPPAAAIPYDDPQANPTGDQDYNQGESWQPQQDNTQDAPSQAQGENTATVNQPQQQDPQKILAYLMGAVGAPEQEVIQKQAQAEGDTPNSKMADAINKELQRYDRSAAFRLLQGARKLWTGYGAHAHAANEGNDQKPPNPQAAAQSATQAASVLPDPTQHVGFQPTPNGYMAHVTTAGKVKQVPISPQQFSQLFDPRGAGQWDQVMEKGLGAQVQQVASTQQGGAIPDYGPTGESGAEQGEEHVPMPQPRPGAAPAAPQAQTGAASNKFLTNPPSKGAIPEGDNDEDEDETTGADTDKDATGPVRSGLAPERGYYDENMGYHKTAPAHQASFVQKGKDKTDKATMGKIRIMFPTGRDKEGNLYGGTFSGTGEQLTQDMSPKAIAARNAGGDAETKLAIAKLRLQQAEESGNSREKVQAMKGVQGAEIEASRAQGRQAKLTQQADLFARRLDANAQTEEAKLASQYFKTIAADKGLSTPQELQTAYQVARQHAAETMNVQPKQQPAQAGRPSVAPKAVAPNLAPADRAAWTWAQANPRDPRAIKIMQHLNGQ